MWNAVHSVESVSGPGTSQSVNEVSLMRAIWQCGFSTLRDWASWRKLEPGLRMAIANKDLDMAACYCHRYEMAAVTPAVISIIREMKASTEAGLSQLARIKRTCQPARRAQLSKVTAPVKYLQTAVFVFPLAAFSAIAFDLTQYFQGPPHCFAPVEALIAADSPLLIIALSISVLGFFLQQNMEARARELERLIDDLATDLIISFLDDGKRCAATTYQPGKWIQLDAIQPLTPVCSAKRSD